MLKKIKTVFIKVAGWPEGYTVCEGDVVTEKLRRDIREMQKIVENSGNTQENILKKKSLSLLKEVVSA